MKLNKRILIPGLALALFLAFPLAQAAPAEPAPLEKLESLQDQLWAKDMELTAAQRAGNVQETRSLAADMNKLRTQIREERRRLAGSGLGEGRDRGGSFMGWNCPGGGRGPGGWGPGPRSGPRGGSEGYGPGWGPSCH
jgi:hypothetical protein